MLSEVFWVAFITTITGMLIKLASMAYKSKCRECDVCCIKIKRDVDLEEKETEFRIRHSLKDSPSKYDLNEEKNSV
jgi:hypothetical protein